MSSPDQLCSPHHIPSTRHLLNSSSPTRPHRESRFNLRLFERPALDPPSSNAFTLREVPLPYEYKRNQVEILRKREVKWAIVNAALTVVVVLAVIVDNEMGFEERISQLQSSAIRVLIITISLLQAAILVQSARFQLQTRILQGRLHPSSTLYPASLLLEGPRLLLLIGQITHLCICMPPWLDYTFHISHDTQTYQLPVNNLITIAVFLRVVYIYHCLHARSPYHSQRAQFYL